MRTIKFRGKRIDNGEWVYGDLLHYLLLDGLVYNSAIRSACIYGVAPETVGQFTGLTDKNGNEIYEGDILKIKTDKPMLVGWSKRFASFVLNRNGWAFSHWFGESCNPEDCEIIGNIHDNPELLTK